jgi:hypothetical protein
MRLILWTDAEYSGARSPSPRPSPPRRGRSNRQVLECCVRQCIQRAATQQEPGERCTLSLGERAGVAVFGHRILQSLRINSRRTLSVIRDELK